MILSVSKKKIFSSFRCLSDLKIIPINPTKRLSRNYMASNWQEVDF